MWTRKASLLLGLGALALAVGLATLSMAVTVLGLLLISFLTVNRFLFRGSADLRATRQMGIHRVYEGETTEVVTRIENPGKRLVFLEVRDRLPRQLELAEGQSYDFIALPSGHVDELAFSIRAPLLGVYEVGPTDLRLEDPFGLYYEERHTRASDTFWVLPRKEDLRKAALVSNLPMPLLGEHQVNRPGDGFDFFALRDYVPGDTMRSVNWKASARTGKMMVNQMMQTTAAEVAVFIDARGITAAGPESSSPRVIGARAVSSLIEFIFSRKDQPRVIIYDDHVREIEPQPPERMIPYVLETLAELRPKGHYPFQQVVRQVLPTLKQMTPVLVVSPLLDDATVVTGMSTLLTNEMQVAAICPRPTSLPGLSDDVAGALLAERVHTVKDLQGLGVVVVDLEADASLAATLEKGRVLLA